MMASNGHNDLRNEKKGVLRIYGHDRQGRTQHGAIKTASRAADIELGNLQRVTVVTGQLHRSHQRFP